MGSWVVGGWGDGAAAGGGGGGPKAHRPRIPSEDDLFYHESMSEIFSRKVFVGGLPIDISETELQRTFGQFGNVLIDWPHKNHCAGYVPPKGYVFLVFETEGAVQALVSACYTEHNKHYILITSPLMKDKPVQVRPWRLADSDFVVDEAMELNTRRTVFLGGVPRPLKAVALARIMDRLFGNVCYAGIDSDPELKYPKVRPFPSPLVVDEAMELNTRRTVFLGGVPRPLKAVALARIMDRLFGNVCYAGIDSDPELKYPKVRPFPSPLVVDEAMELNTRRTVFLGGVPRPLKAVALARIMDRLFGNVCYAGIDSDPELKYPKVRPFPSPLVVDEAMELNTRRTVFLGGVPRPLKAVALARIMDRLFGNVCYAGIDSDPELKYPKVRPFPSPLVVDEAMELNTRRTVFLGGVPRPLKAVALARIMDRLFGNVCYAGIDSDPELKYPKVRPFPSPLVVDEAMELNTRRTVFLGGVPRPLKAVALARIMDRLFGNVCYAGIDSDPELKYPKVRPFPSPLVVDEAMELNTRRTVFLGGVPRPLKAVALARIMDRLFGNVCYAGIDSDPELKYPKVRPFPSPLVVDEAMELNTRRTVFLGGVPRPLKAVALARIMDRLFGNVCYAGIDSDPELKYPKVRPFPSPLVVDEAMELNTRRTVFLGGVPRPLKAVALARIMDRLFGNVCYAGIDSDPELKYPKVRPFPSPLVVDEAMELNTRRTVFLGGVPRPLKAVALARIMDRLFGNVCYAGIDSDPELKYPKVRPFPSPLVVDEAMELNTRRTVFLGGVPRPLKAVALARIMDRLFGNVCYAGIDSDPELKYPNGAGRVSFATNASYIAAIAAKFVHLQHGDVDKRVEVKPYVLDDSMCDECGGSKCGGKFAPYFCADVSCLQYYCEECWSAIHAFPRRAGHAPFQKDNAKERRLGLQRVSLHPALPHSARLAADHFNGLLPHSPQPPPRHLNHPRPVHNHHLPNGYPYQLPIFPFPK